MLNKPSNTLLIGVYFIPPFQVAVRKNIPGLSAIAVSGIYPRNTGNIPRRTIRATLFTIKEK